MCKKFEYLLPHSPTAVKFGVGKGDTTVREHPVCGPDVETCVEVVVDEEYKW